ncbi:SDR family NAD(P)-dependent oxidoreductase [Sphingomonas piscis]|uniref:SDR family NAD(P)-dependent oxidoreductase n=1 Tax=Sphingomonas piscis TaxID=2714943 RepID=A0A6G7YQ13_9SPHN|nr:SDR family NAD(P)-dependent oxidoreductase [Sphingomonas piscis]QIK78832.1 SDR family NAD(P)-dependent oxidoreductase [Sphingomonas piscis]
MSARRAAVIGANGGLGAALCDGLEARGFDVVRLSRNGDDGVHVDIEAEASIAAAAARVAEQGSLTRIIVAAGLLHNEGLSPERSLKDLQQDRLAKLFAVNAIGPILVAKHFVPLLARDAPSLFAALSARVGSIGDNRVGGWYGYRASKAALNMFIRTLAIEVARTRPLAVCAGLHPGTVDTALSKPFQRGVAAGKLFTPAQSAGYLLDVMDGLTPTQSGRCFAWDGQEIAP